jgi:lysophospholipase L1-like esterase
MKPFRIFIFFLLVCALLFGLAMVFPTDGIELGKGMKLRFVSSESLLTKEIEVSHYTDSLIKNSAVYDDPEWEPQGEGTDTLPQPPQQEEDVIQLPDPPADPDSLVLARIDSISSRIYPIRFSDQSYQALLKFFEQAEQLQKNREVLRILHYGDSQIENDRMTSLLRYRFQKQFGGSGCGMVPAIPLYSGNPAFRDRAEGSWTRHTGFGQRDTTHSHSSYGAMACYTAVPEPENGLLPSIEFSFLSGRRASQFSYINTFLHSYMDTGFIAVQLNDTIHDTLTFYSGGYHRLTLQSGIEARKVKMEFSLPAGGRVYGISFDPPSGIQMDNMAMRGSSGLEFSRLDRELLDTMLTDMNIGMVILQFGGNMVPYIRNFSFYKKALKRELNFMKQICPGIPIILIGPADMSTKSDGKFITYETLEPLRDVMRAAAIETGCAFWDMYEAMGGENSIQDFVQADPPLATPDYIHFTPRGANLLAGMFFESVMLEYERYRSGLTSNINF